ncbi:MAG: A/G-specific adenine glycosylase [Methylococcales symbiont of Iophon sp. n. MRB-2018]|nr:MAG: A/G-specific adenine glycosylase [Methylococcales symbiont of Iophon sp. n. MRB-2018]KAF3979580.1 MAG: A/G-specific adenine glycosylase [Methylococcales symbiont of Iophon sp. n. MRB-2018]
MLTDQFQQKVLTWFDSNGRKDLPWQQAISPYRVWLSEVMLQQTQVSTVIPYFNEFIEQFPNINALASAPLDSVLHLWAGLGYYARARNLHKTATLISANGGVFPDQLDALIALPGIGRSTAGAILSIAFNKSYPILDANVRRVLARHYAIAGWSGHTKISNQLWAISTLNTPVKRSADYTQAMMDLGATLCTRSKPLCNQCPISASCLAKIENKVHFLPTAKPTKTIPVKNIFFLILQNQQQQFLLEKRPASGIWGGLWSLLEFDSIENIHLWGLDKNMPVQAIKTLKPQRHTFSHYHLDYTTVLAKTKMSVNNVMESNALVWYKAGQIKSLGLPAPIKKILQEQY